MRKAYHVHLSSRQISTKPRAFDVATHTVHSKIHYMNIASDDSSSNAKSHLRFAQESFNVSHKSKSFRHGQGFLALSPLCELADDTLAPTV